MSSVGVDGEFMIVEITVEVIVAVFVQVIVEFVGVMIPSSIRVFSTTIHLQGGQGGGMHDSALKRMSRSH